MDDLREVSVRLAENARLTDLGKLVAELAHELNNAITAHTGFYELLREPDLGPVKRRKLEGLAREASERTSEILRNLLSFARLDDPEPVLLDLNEILTRTVRLKCYSLRLADIRVRLQLDPVLPGVWGNASQIQSVFLNIINNAQYAMRDVGGPGVLEISTARGERHVSVEIADSGPGVGLSTLEEVFEPFFTTKRPGEGTGLGLSISRDIITRHGGRIWLESESGRGVTCHVELPYGQSPGTSAT